MVRTFRHKGLKRLFESDDPGGVQADQVRRKGPGLSVGHRALAAIVAGTPADAQAIVQELSGPTSIDRKAALEFVADAVKDPKTSSAEAARLLKVILALECDVPQLPLDECLPAAALARDGSSLHPVSTSNECGLRFAVKSCPSSTLLGSGLLNSVS